MTNFKTAVLSFVLCDYFVICALSFVIVISVARGKLTFIRIFAFLSELLKLIVHSLHKIRIAVFFDDRVKLITIVVDETCLINNHIKDLPLPILAFEFVIEADVDIF